MSNNIHRDILIARWLDGDLTGAEAVRLLDFIRENDENWEVLRKNIWADFFLQERFDLLRKRRCEQEEYRQNEQVSPLGAEKDTCNDSLLCTSADWEQLVLLERGASPVVKPLRKEPVKDLVPSVKSSPHDVCSATSRNKKVDPQRKSRFWLLPIAILAFILLIGSAEWFAVLQKQQRLSQPTGSAGAAQVRETIDVVWTNGSPKIKRGQLIGPDVLSFDSGLLKLDFADGAELVVEGPARLTINGPADCFCEEGKISAHVPPRAIGFTVISRFGAIIDRGTEFYADITREEAKFEVISGRVEFVESNERPVLQLVQKAAVRLRHETKPESYTFEQSSFIDSKVLQKRLLEYTAHQEQLKSAVNQKVDFDRSLLARFDFSHVKTDGIQNSSVVNRSRIPKARLYRCEPTEGPFYGTVATRFTGSESQVDFELPGRYDSMTLLARIRIDRLSNVGNVIFSTDSYYDNVPGSFLWQILKEGNLQFQLVPENRLEQTSFLSEPIRQQKEGGIWFTTALTIDAPNKTITFYVDGKKLSSQTWNAPIPLLPRQCRIGNMNTGKHGMSRRFFEGALDEFLLFDRILSPEEIAQWNQ